MTLETWLKYALEDAERRGLPEIKPMLEALARATLALRQACATSPLRPDGDRR